ncbi:hypothetical protein G0U57_020911, partial [Chelydra serpentina]
PPKGTPSYHMYVYYGPKTCRYLKDWNSFMRENPSKQFPVEGTFDLDKLTYLRETFTSPKASDTQWEQFVYWWEEATKRLHESRVRSLKDSQEKLKNQVQDLKFKCKASEYLPTRATAPLYPQLVKITDSEGETAEDIVDFFSNVPPQQLPPAFPQAAPAGNLPTAASGSLPHVSSPGESSSSPLPHQQRRTDSEPSSSSLDAGSPDPDSSSSPVSHHTRSQVPTFQAPLRELPGAAGNLVVVHAPWTPGDLRNLVKEFPKVREEPEMFRDELQTVIQCYNPSWADVNQLLR